MRTADEIEKDLASLGRPSMGTVAAINLKALSQLRQEQLAWDEQHPAEAARFKALLVESRGVEEASQNAARLEAEKVRASAAVRRIVGNKIADVLVGVKLSQTHAMGAAREFDECPAWCLALLGGVGSGKSVAAGWLTHQSLARGNGVCWLRATEAATGSLYGPEAQQRAHWARGARLMVLDDFGAEFASEPWKAWLEDVLGARYANGGRTVITSNLDAEAFKVRMGERLTDRIREGMVVGTASVSMRRRLA